MFICDVKKKKYKEVKFGLDIKCDLGYLSLFWINFNFFIKGVKDGIEV